MNTKIFIMICATSLVMANHSFAQIEPTNSSHSNKPVNRTIPIKPKENSNIVGSTIERAGGGGNGGDYIRLKFIEVGQKILKNHSAAIEKCIELDHAAATLDDLQESLSINVLEVSTEMLFDNLGNPVNALAKGPMSEGGKKITLYIGEKEKLSWQTIFNRKDLAVDILVLHELMRSIGINDDDYFYSMQALSVFDLYQDSNGQLVIESLSTSKYLLQNAINASNKAAAYQLANQQLVAAIKEAMSILPERFVYLCEIYARSTETIIKSKLGDDQKYFVLSKISMSLKSTVSDISELLVKNQGIWNDHSFSHQKYVEKTITNFKDIIYIIPSIELEQMIINQLVDNLLDTCFPYLDKESQFKQSTRNQYLTFKGAIGELQKENSIQRKKYLFENLLNHSFLKN